MATVLTFRMSSGKLAQVDRRTAELGRDHSGYIRRLIDQDLEQSSRPHGHKFAVGTAATRAVALKNG